MSPTFSIVMRIRVHVGVSNRSPCELMRMGKESGTCVITHKERYEKYRQYFFCVNHKHNDMQINIKFFERQSSQQN